MGFDAFPAVEEEDAALAVLGNGGDGVEGAALRPEHASLGVYHAVVLHGHAVVSELFPPGGVVQFDDVGLGKAGSVGAGHEEGAEAAHHARVVYVGSAAHVACARRAVRQVHAGVDGCREVVELAPFAQGSG